MTAPREAGDHAAAAADCELVSRLVQGELEALGILYDRHHEVVRRFLRHIAGGSSDTDDLVQEVFLTLLRIAASYDGRPSARSFLIGIAAQHARHDRGKRARWARALRELGATLARHVGMTPEHATSNAQEIHLAGAALDRLSPEKRMVFLLVERDGLSGEEVAAALEIPVATVWTRLHYARIELRSAIERPWKRAMLAPSTRVAEQALSVDVAAGPLFAATEPAPPRRARARESAARGGPAQAVI